MSHPRNAALGAALERAGRREARAQTAAAPSRGGAARAATEAVFARWCAVAPAQIERRLAHAQIPYSDVSVLKLGDRAAQRVWNDTYIDAWTTLEEAGATPEHVLGNGQRSRVLYAEIERWVKHVLKDAVPRAMRGRLGELVRPAPSVHDDTEEGHITVERLATLSEALAAGARMARSSTVGWLRLRTYNEVPAHVIVEGPRACIEWLVRHDAEAIGVLASSRAVPKAVIDAAYHWFDPGPPLGLWCARALNGTDIGGYSTARNASDFAIEARLGAHHRRCSPAQAVRQADALAQRIETNRDRWVAQQAAQTMAELLGVHVSARQMQCLDDMSWEYDHNHRRRDDSRPRLEEAQTNGAGRGEITWRLTLDRPSRAIVGLGVDTIETITRSLLAHHRSGARQTTAWLALGFTAIEALRRHSEDGTTPKPTISVPIDTTP